MGKPNKTKQQKRGQGSGGKGTSKSQGTSAPDPEGPRLDTLACAVAHAVQAALPPAAGLSEEDVAGLLERPPDAAMGDFAFPCFRLARALRKAPAAIAADVTEALRAQLDAHALVAAAEATGPYVNLRLDPGVAAALLLPKLAREAFNQPPARATRIMVEFSQPNTHKAFHVGHMRNLCLGDALVRLLRLDGYPVIAANYFGDVGAHIAKCLWWYLDHLSDEEREPPDSYRGEWLGQIYARGNLQLTTWKEQAAAGDEAAAQALAAAKTRIADILRKLEAREPEMHAIWERTRQMSLTDFEDVYAWTDAHFDVLFYESQVDEAGLKIVDEYLDKGVFTVSEGAAGIFNPEVKHMPFFMLRKRDGNSLYATKDLVLARMKFEQHNIDRSIYVVDVRQSDHFRHVFLTLQKMGFAQAARCQHVPYEVVELPDGPMGARKGNVILFRSLREQMLDTIVRKHLEEHRGDWSDADIDRAAHEVALGSIRYGMLARDVNQKIIFDMDAWTALDGNTGVYLQYAYARAGSVLTKGAARGKTLDPELLTRAVAANAEILRTLIAPQERELLLALTGLERTLHAAAAQLRPSLVCTYLFNLSQSFNRFHYTCHVLNQEGDLLQARLLLVTAFTKAMARGLSALGIPAPARV